MRSPISARRTVIPSVLKVPPETEDLKENTKFRELDEWSSLAVLSVIAMLDEEYDTQIENADFKKLQTISDIVQFIECQK